MKIALAQIDPTIGDIDYNVAKIKEAVDRARAEDADLCVFPEMAISGYPPLDLLERSGFVAANEKALQEIADYSKGIGVLVGSIRPTIEKSGKRIQNIAALVEDGKIVEVHTKQLLPTYDVFDERRYFEPASCVALMDYKGRRLGVTICEDIWNVEGFVPSGLYKKNPVIDLVEQGADVLINLSASPYDRFKRLGRNKMLMKVASSHKLPLVFVNQVGGNDELLFDGRSAVYNADGQIVERAKAFEEDMLVLNVDDALEPIEFHEASEERLVIDALVMGIRDYARKCGFKSAVIGLSGGIDSAVVAALAVKALGPDKVFGVGMPTRFSSEGSVTDSVRLAANLGMDFKEIPIEKLFGDFLETLQPHFEGRKPDVTEENIQARIRGVILMSLSNKFGHLLLTTGNKSEVAVGYATLYGDMAGGLAPISDVPKTMVYRLARTLNEERELVPPAIIEKEPSAELANDQRDQDSLPPYPMLDAILERYIDYGMDVQQIVAEDFDEDIVRDVISKVRRNEYKRRQAPPGLKISFKAFGFGRRMPIAQRWQG